MGAVSLRYISVTDAAKTMRLLQKVKSFGQKPSSKWDESLAVGGGDTTEADSDWVPAGPAVGMKMKTACSYLLSPNDFPLIF